MVYVYIYIHVHAYTYIYIYIYMHICLEPKGLSQLQYTTGASIMTDV